MSLPKYAVAVGKSAQRPQEVHHPVRTEDRPQAGTDVVQSIPVDAVDDFVGRLPSNDQLYLRHAQYNIILLNKLTGRNLK